LQRVSITAAPVMVSTVMAMERLSFMRHADADGDGDGEFAHYLFRTATLQIKECMVRRPQPAHSANVGFDNP
jgi:hypothetical protein